MFELGDYTEEGHGKIGALTKKMNLRQVIFCGERMRFAQAENKDSLYFKTRKELEEFLENHIFENSIILIKGSRAMALENIVEKL
jgi:UDP-N-acetylmuramoyl-tripeptide--D-alanyl-D-alanine ligase